MALFKLIQLPGERKWTFIRMSGLMMREAKNVGVNMRDLQIYNLPN